MRWSEDASGIACKTSPEAKVISPENRLYFNFTYFNYLDDWKHSQICFLPCKPHFSLSFFTSISFSLMSHFTKASRTALREAPTPCLSFHHWSTLFPHIAKDAANTRPLSSAIASGENPSRKYSCCIPSDPSNITNWAKSVSVTSSPILIECQHKSIYQRYCIMCTLKIMSDPHWDAMANKLQVAWNIKHFKYYYNQVNHDTKWNQWTLTLPNDCSWNLIVCNDLAI